MTDFYPADVGRVIVAGGGRGTITGYTDGQTVTVTVDHAFPAGAFNSGYWTILGSPRATCTPSAATPVGAGITLTLSAAGWRPEDKGSYVRINGGLCKITSITSTTIAAASIERELTSVVAAPPLAWTLEGSVWSPTYGYPRCGVLYQQRNWLAGSTAFPQRAWGSVIGQYFDMTLGTFDDDALAFDLASGEYNPILHMASGQNLVALTLGGEFTIRGGTDRAITPTNIQVRDQSAHGSSGVRPVRIGNEVFFNQRAGRKVRALTANQYDSEKYIAPDMSVQAEHITESGLVEMAYQQEPGSVLYAVRNDGVLATLTAERDQEVFAWSRQTTVGRFESVCTVPAPDGDRVFVVVARTIGGVETRYIEVFDPALNTDSALTGSSPTPITVWDGFDHLEGMLLRVKGDGVRLTDCFVIGGEITIERAASRIEAGLNYNTEILTLTPELSVPANSLAGSQLSVHEVWVRLKDTIGCTINLQQVPFRQLGIEVLDHPIEPFSGIKKAGNLGWDSGNAQTLIQQTEPYDFHLLAVITKLSANEG